MEAAEEQDGAVCVCAGNQKKEKTLRVFAQLRGGGDGGPSPWIAAFFL